MSFVQARGPGRDERAGAGRRWPSPGRGAPGSGDFREGGLDVVGGGEFGPCERRRQQGVMGEQIDLARQPAGRLVSASSAEGSKSGTSALARRSRCAR